MSNGTKSGYTKAGKKVMCVNSNQRDLTYKKVYDVFTNQDSADFIIDDVGDKRYESMEFPSWCEVFDDAAEANNETKPKFKVGDKVKVVDTKQISQWTKDIDVGCVGFVVDVNVNDEYTPYKVKLDKCYYDWWFTDKCIELVNDVVTTTDTIENNPTESAPIVSDGGSSSYYAQQIPKGMLERFNTTGIIEAKDVIRLFLGNDFNMGNIFKAYCRIISLRNGKGKAGIDEQYDLTKVKYFAEDELNYYLENKDV